MRIHNAEWHYAKNQVFPAVCNGCIAIHLSCHNAQELKAMDHILVCNVEQTDDKLNAYDLICPTMELTWEGVWQ